MIRLQLIQLNSQNSKIDDYFNTPMTKNIIILTLMMKMTVWSIQSSLPTEIERERENHYKQTHIKIDKVFRSIQYKMHFMHPWFINAINNDNNNANLLFITITNNNNNNNHIGYQGQSLLWMVLENESKILCGVFCDTTFFQ